jgi:phosphoglycolate phosphatase
VSLVLFDIDGTLLRRAGSHHKLALIEGVRRVTGFETTLDGIDTSGMLDRDLIAAMMRATGVSSRRIRATLWEIMSECQTAYHQNCAADLRDRLCTGVVETLAALRDAGATLGVVTGNLTQIGWKKLDLAGVRQFFTVGAFAEDGRSRGRLARVAVWRARRNGLPRDAEVSLIGDHPNDIHAAKVNGFRSVAVGTGVVGMDALASAEPDILVRDLTELRIHDLL